MATPDTGWTALYDTEAGAAAAARSLSAEQRARARGFSPIPAPDLAQAVGAGESPLGWFTLAGALGGMALGFGLSAYAASVWELGLSGKPVYAYIPFVVIAFEFAVLLGAVSSFAVTVALGGMPRFKTTPGYHPDCMRDKYGLFVPCQGDERETVRALLEKSGAAEVHGFD